MSAGMVLSYDRERDQSSRHLGSGRRRVSHGTKAVCQQRLTAQDHEATKLIARTASVTHGRATCAPTTTIASTTATRRTQATLIGAMDDGDRGALR